MIRLKGNNAPGNGYTPFTGHFTDAESCTIRSNCLLYKTVSNDGGGGGGVGACATTGSAFFTAVSLLPEATWGCFRFAASELWQPTTKKLTEKYTENTRTLRLVYKAIFYCLSSKIDVKAKS
jgi:hypothetical protein